MNTYFAYLLCYLAGGATVAAWWWWIYHKAKARAVVQDVTNVAKKL